MDAFVHGAVIKSIDVAGKRWSVRVANVYNPSAEEIASNQAFNNTLGNWEPEREKPIEPLVRLEIAAVDGERFEMYWVPTSKVLGPHIRRAGWERGTFNAVKRELLRWRLP